jgi:fructokinase
MTGLFGGIEAGGTKFVCAVGTGPGDFEEVRFDTTTPGETLERCAAYFAPYRSGLRALGIGSFGPVDLDECSRAYGYITSTPKAGWANTDFAGWLSRRLGCPVGFDTDVNAAALGEFQWGAARDLANFLYLTIGTGIGGGGMVNGRLLHGLVHPEMGHIFLPRHPRDCYAGGCAYHGNACFEGLASGPAIEERWGRAGTELGAEHEAWEMEAYYIALALVSYICTLSPQRIILGGGVMGQRQLLSMVRRKTGDLLNGYIQSPSMGPRLDLYIVSPGLGNRSGVLGAIALAQQALRSGNSDSAEASATVPAEERRI